MPENGHLNGSQQGGEKGYLWTFESRIFHCSCRKNNRYFAILFLVRLSLLLSRERVCDRILRSYLKKGAVELHAPFIF